VSVVVYDVRGKVVQTVVDGTLPSGNHSISWAGKDQAGRDVANGVYFCRVKVGNIEKTAKMLLID
jgi:flagellar hook assembly protein FlgD